MKLILFFLFLLKYLILNIEAKKNVFLPPRINENKENNILENPKNCIDECYKLSETYPCFCDSSCNEYGDCCKSFIKGCENNLFSITENSHLIKLPDNPVDKNITTKNIIKLNHTIKNITKIKRLNNFVKVEYNGRCCDDRILPFDCFCDSKCLSNSDCCEDYEYCSKTNYLNQTLVESIIQKN